MSRLSKDANDERRLYANMDGDEAELEDEIPHLPSEGCLAASLSRSVCVCCD